jgi:hypothetical protein
MAGQGTARLVKTRLYLEGRLLENAFVSIMVRGGAGQPAMAQIELVPTNTVKHIMPGTWVHVFTTDPWDDNPAGDLSDYKLLHEGVVTSRAFNRRDSGRGFVIQTADPSIFWTNAKQFWMNISSANGGLVDQLAVQTSGGYGRFGTVSATGSYGYMISKLGLTANTQAEERFMDTMISVLDDIGNVNPYYTNARNRFRITDRIIRGPAGNTDKLFQVALLSDLLEGLAGRISGQSNLIEVVNQLLGVIFHEWVSIPAPPYIKQRIFDRDVFGNIKRTKTTVTSAGPRGRDAVDLYDFSVAQDNVVASFIFKPHVYTISPPSCNVLFPNMYDGLQWSEDFLGEPTRLSMKPQMPTGIPAGVTQGLLLQRPTELEVFYSLVRDPKRVAQLKRTPDGNYADGAGQVPTFTDYDWATNEERIRGIVYNFVNLAPAPSTLTLGDPGARQPSGTRVGGIPKYLQNVASYEWYKSKFAARQTTLSGPYNMRPVPGFPIIALDDSAANLNLVANLEVIVHNIQANGSATTQYSLTFARLADEVDLNRPRFNGGWTKDSQGNDVINLDLYRDASGQYDFTKFFEGKNQPPVPEWFDASFVNIVDLDLKYQSWFGPDCGVMQHFLFKNPGDKPSEVAQKEASTVLNAALGGDFATVGDALKAYATQKQQFEDILAANENIEISDAIDLLNERYRIARVQGNEFPLSSHFTKRSFTKIDEAFKFIGAAPLEYADKTKSNADTIARFTQSPAATRQINYTTARLDFFVGDVSAGAGYTGATEGTAPTAPTVTSTANAGGLVPDAISGADLAPPPNRMSGAFPVFDTIIHTGAQATDQSTRAALISSGAERAPSDRARYDGRPLMFDFEFRLWQQSLHDAGFAPTGERLAANAVNTAYITDPTNGNVVRPKSPAEQVASIQASKDNIAAQQKADISRPLAGKVDPTNVSSLPPSEQAPTGDGLEQNQLLPLTQPLSEKQVIDLRRAVIDAYRAELARTRGFTG